jgi:ribosome recycling factor
VIDDTLLETEEKMEKAVAVAKEEFAAVRTGRITPQAFSKITVDYYGVPTLVNQMATLTVPEPRMALIAPYDTSQLGALERAIRDSDLGVNPTSDGKILRVIFPELTSERRQQLVKVVRTKAEEARVSIRAIRRHGMEALDKIVKDGRAGEDDVRRAEKDLEETTHTYVAQVEDLLKQKESELLEV